MAGSAIALFYLEFEKQSGTDSQDFVSAKSLIPSNKFSF